MQPQDIIFPAGNPAPMTPQTAVNHLDDLWPEMCTYGGAAPAFNARGELTSRPQDVPASGLFVYTPPRGHDLLVVRAILYHGTDADGKTARCRIWSLRNWKRRTNTTPRQAGSARPMYGFAEPLLQLTMTAGQMEHPDADQGTAAYGANLTGWVDTFTLDADYSRGGAEVIGASDHAKRVEADACGAAAYLFAITRESTTDIDGGAAAAAPCAGLWMVLSVL